MYTAYKTHVYNYLYKQAFEIEDVPRDYNYLCRVCSKWMCTHRAIDAAWV